MRITSQILYRDIIKRSFIVAWKNKFLWIFGFFASFLGLGSMYNFVLKDLFNTNELFTRFGGKLTFLSASGIVISENISNVSLSKIFILFLLMLAAVAVCFFMLWLAISSFGSLIKSAAVLDKNRKMNFAKSFTEGKMHFWPLLGINILGKVLIFLFLTVTGAVLSLVLINNSILQSLLYFFVSLVLISISLLISFLIIYASCFVVLKSKRFLESIREAWDLFKKNWVVSVEAALILFFINFLVKIVLAILLVLLSVPFMVLMLILYSTLTSFLSPALLAIWAVFSIILMIIVGSFFSAFQIVAWTFIFDKIAKGGLISKLYRLFR